MRTIAKILAGGVLAIILGVSAQVQAQAIDGSGFDRVADQPAFAGAPHFSQFLADVQSHGTNAGRWLRVVRPTLADLRYSSLEVEGLKKALRAGLVTEADAGVFCERWFIRHNERVNPAELQAFFCNRNRGNAH